MGSISAARDSPTTERPFLFTRLSTTDDDSVACTNESIVKAMGQIDLRILRISVVHDHVKQKGCGNHLAEATLHEESKKARLSHQTG